LFRPRIAAKNCVAVAETLFDVELQGVIVRVVAGFEEADRPELLVTAAVIGIAGGRSGAENGRIQFARVFGLREHVSAFVSNRCDASDPVFSELALQRQVPAIERRDVEVLAEYGPKCCWQSELHILIRDGRAILGREGIRDARATPRIAKID